MPLECIKVLIWVQCYQQKTLTLVIKRSSVDAILGKFDFVKIEFGHWGDRWILGSGPKAIKLFSLSTQLSKKFILLINVKMLTIVGILTFINMLNTTSERFKGRNFFNCRYCSFYEQLKFRTRLRWAWKKFITWRPEQWYGHALMINSAIPQKNRYTERIYLSSLQHLSCMMSAWATVWSVSLLSLLALILETSHLLKLCW